MLLRNIRIVEDLVDQLFSSSEKRLARALLLLARQRLHEEFRNLGFIESNGGLKDPQLSTERHPHSQTPLSMLTEWD
jgi:hypothetical protein